MSPRRYRMGARADRIQDTRDRLVVAAMRLHTERGVLATRWDEIAAEAGVSTATMYRHFPSLAELVPACARTVFDLIKPPTVAEASPQFATYDDAADRFEYLVRVSVHCYAAGAGWLHAAHRERDFVPELDAALRLIEDTLRVLVRAAAGGELPGNAAAELFVLCNFPLWRQLLDAGPSADATEETLVTLVRDAASRLDARSTR